MERPEPSSRHPLIVFLLGLCVLSGLGILLDVTPAPGSIEAALYRWEVVAWALALGGGATLVLVGLALQPNDERLVLGVLFEQVGVATLGPAAIIYSAAAVAAVGWSGFFPAAMTFTFGVACLFRWWTLQRQFRKASRRKVTAQ